MPNWCTNIVEIVSGNDRDLDGVMSLLTDATEPFALIIPRPDNADAYAWQVSNWGTKWEAGGFDIHRSGSHIVMNFSTAWSPSVMVTAALADKFPSLEIRHLYEEPGMGFTGCARFGEGRQFSDDCRDITDKESRWDEDGEENEDFVELSDRF